MVLDGELIKTLDAVKTSLNTMPISDRLLAWQEIHNQKLDTSNLDFNPNSIPLNPFDPEDINSVFDIKISYDKGSNKPSKIKPTVPANVFKDMIKDFKASGGKFVRRDGYQTGFKSTDNIIRLGPKDFVNHKGDFRSVIAHEMGHSFTTPSAKSPKDLPSSIPKFKLNKSPDKNAYDKPYSRKEFTEYIDGTIYDELNADLEVLKRMRLGGASKTQMSDYAKDAIESIKTYKRGLITQFRGTYSDYTAVKNVLLNNPKLSQPTTKILSKDPEIISDFDKLLEKLLDKLNDPTNLQNISGATKTSITPQQTILTLKTELQAQKKIAYDNHKQITDQLEGRLTRENLIGVKEQRYADNNLNIHATETYMIKNLTGFKDFKKMVSETTQSFRVRELEGYVIDHNKKANKTNVLQDASYITGSP